MQTKTFTIKDFINYGSPCFSCNSKMTFTINCVITNVKMVNLSPTIINDRIDVNLELKYNNSLTLSIFPKINKFEVSNRLFFIQYLKSNELSLRLFCDNCNSVIRSNMLEFNLNKKFIKPTFIENEITSIKDGKYFYELYSNFDSPLSTLYISLLDNSDITKNTKIDLPLLPLYKLKNKEALLQKIKTYLLFS